VFVDFADDAAFGVLAFVHATRPRTFALLAESIQLILPVVVSLGDGLSADGLLHVGAERELGVGRDVRCLLQVVNFFGDHRIDCLVGASRELVSDFSFNLVVDLGVSLFFLAHLLLDVFGQLLRPGVLSTRHLRLVHQHFLIGLSGFSKHGFTSCVKEALAVTSVDELSRAIPAGVVGVTGVSSSVHTLVLHPLDSLVLQTLLDIEKLLRNEVFLGVSD